MHGILSLLAGTLTLATGVLVLFQGKQGEKNRCFFYLTLASSLWITSFGFLSRSPDETSAYFWQSVAYLGVPFISPTVYRFSAVWTGRRKRWVDAVGFGTAVALALGMIAYPEKIVSIEQFEWGRYPVFLRNNAATVYSAVLVFNFYLPAVLAFRNFFLGWKEALSPTDRKQLGTIVTAFLIAYTGSVDFATSFHRTVYPFGYLSITLFFVGVAYAIFRFRMFEANLAFRRLAILMLAYVVAGILAMPIYRHLLGEVFPLQGSAVRSFVGAAFLSGLLIVSAPLVYVAFLRRSFWLRHREGSGLAHELKSPISAIHGAIEVVSSADVPRDVVTHYLALIKNNADRLHRFAEDLIELSKSNEGSRPSSLADFDLIKIVDDAVKNLEPFAKSKGVEIQIQHTSHATVHGNQEHTQRALNNVLSNAIKFANGRPIRIGFDQRFRWAVCSIRDSGDGFPTDLTERIFERFFQQKHHVGQGSGLGLSLAKEWIEEQGGRIWAESDGPGLGSCFTLALPTTTPQREKGLAPR